jgi:ATP-dependent DNA helicase RecQ
MRPEMTSNFLAEIGIAPDDVLHVAGQRRTQLLSFLQRWRATAELHACLDILLQEHPDLVSLLDLRARALAAEGRFDEALQTMEARLQRKSSVPALSLVADIHLARGAIAAAEGIARTLIDEDESTYTGWRIRAEAALRRGDLAAAAAANHRLGELRPNGTRYLLAMMALYQARGDWVTASGYAVRLLNTVEDPTELPPIFLEALMAYFKASGEETRVVEVGEALDARYAQELAEIKAALAPEAGSPLPVAPDDGKVSLPPSPGEGLGEGDAAHTPIPVTDSERAHIQDAVRDTFGFEQLLPGQLETLACVFRGDNALTILPTGGGKSLCYQVPALVAEAGLTVVISPLIALMKDQVDSLPEHLRPLTTTVNSSLDGDELVRRLARAARGDYRLLYAAPERLRQPTFLHTLRKADVARLVVDEAHCVSVWGHDFRPDYLKIEEAWRALGEPPILALTATAPPRVRRDIIQHLSPNRPMATITGDTFRSNLTLEVFEAANRDEKLHRLLSFCLAAQGQGIVYADTRARCEQISELLRSRKIDAEHYHAGIDNRDAVQDRFMEGKTRIIVATIAFGMGIDKADIRFIVHFMPPHSLESYYQEAGRAGRDGQPAHCLLLYSSSDRALLTKRMRSSLPTVEFLRDVYATVQRMLGANGVARVAVGDLERALGADDTRVRVALSILEENGLLTRGPDMPRGALILLRQATAAEPSGNPTPQTTGDGFEAFCRELRLQPNQWLQVDLLEAAKHTGISPEEIEAQVLAWADEGRIACRFSGRELLLQRTGVPGDVAQRIRLWLDRFATIQAQRIDEISAYAHTNHCRHGHLSTYLGGRPIDRCMVCDNCAPIAEAPEALLPTERQQLLTVLGCLDESGHGWGRWSLIGILRGSDRAPDRGQALRAFGALRFRSRSMVEAMIERLLRYSLISERQLDNGGVVLELTPSGRAALRNPRVIDVALSADEAHRPTRERKGWDLPTEGDDALFERLRAWRLAEAEARGVLPYIVFHDATLHAISALKPRSLNALLAIPGVGARKVEAYGEAIIAVVRDYVNEVSGSAAGPNQVE